MGKSTIEYISYFKEVWDTKKIIQWFALAALAIALTACGDDGGGNKAPIAKATATPATIIQGESVTFDGSGSTDSDGTVDKYEWKEGTALLHTGVSFTKNDFTVGTHTITLTVTDNEDATSTDEVNVTVNAPDNTPPVANAGANQNVTTGSTVTLDGSGSSDADGDTLTYKWTMKTKPTGSSAALSDTTAQKPTFTADKDGSYTLELVANDGTVDSAPSHVTVTAHAPECIDNVTVITHNGTTYSCVTSPYGEHKVWLDRNLGASQVCTGFNDTACYGDYYQWGRNADGHENNESNATATLATQIDPVQDAVKGKFIKNGSSPYDWTTASLDDNGSIRSAKWSKTDGTSVCPAGYRVPTLDELKAETTEATDVAGSTKVTNRATAFTNFLKLPSAGGRNDGSGSLYGQGSWGGVWASSVGGSGARYVVFFSGVAGLGSTGRVGARSVRCLRD